MFIDISQKINKMNPVDVSKTERNQILKQNEINVRLLLGHGNVGRKRIEIIASTNNGQSIIRIRE